MLELQIGMGATKTHAMVKSFGINWLVAELLGAACVSRHSGSADFFGVVAQQRARVRAVTPRGLSSHPAGAPRLSRRSRGPSRCPRAAAASGSAPQPAAAMATGDSDGLPEERAAKRARQWYSLWSEACEKAGRPGAARAGATLAAHDAACRKGAAPAVPVAVRSPGGAVTALATPVAVVEASADAGAVAVASCCFNQANDPSHEVPALHAVPATHLELALPPPSPQWGASRYSEGTLLLRNPSSDSEVAFAATVEDADGGRTPGAIAVLSPQVGLVPCCATGAGVAPAFVPLSFSRTAQADVRASGARPDGDSYPPPSTRTHAFGTLCFAPSVPHARARALDVHAYRRQLLALPTQSLCAYRSGTTRCRAHPRAGRAARPVTPPPVPRVTRRPSRCAC